jgi:hypothetical protein
MRLAGPLNVISKYLAGNSWNRESELGRSSRACREGSWPQGEVPCCLSKVFSDVLRYIFQGPNVDGINNPVELTQQPRESRAVHIETGLDRIDFGRVTSALGHVFLWVLG